MASSRRAAGAGNNQPPQPSQHISSLPPELLLAAFQHFPLEERHSSLALVCRQWAELVHSPALLVSLDVAIHASLLPRLRALVEWLAQRAVGHVRQLRLTAGVPEGEATDAWQDSEAAATLASALALLAGSLRHVSLSTHRVSLPPLGSWMVPLAGLTSLELSSAGPNMCLAGPLRCLTALRRLQINATEGRVFVEPEASLPPGLTQLWVRGFEDDVPPQVGELRHLQELTLVGMSCDQDDYAPLACLHLTLTALHLDDPWHLPDCLAQLTALRTLTIRKGENVGDAKLWEEDNDVLLDALPELQQLTAVVVLSDGLRDSHEALASLPRLDTVCWRGISYDREYASEQPLPGGVWLSRLRCLVMPARVLAQAASLAALSGARRLERLRVSSTGWFQRLETRDRPARAFKKWMSNDAEVLRILDWAPGHPSLQPVVLHRMSCAAAPAAAAAQQQRPGLRVITDQDVYGAACGYRLFADV